MYRAHFGLKKALFDGGIAQEEGVFIGPRQQRAIANFKVALTTRDSAILLTGPAGVGKTTLTAAALRTTSTRLALGWIGNTPTNGAELLELLLTEFGFNAHRVGRVERLQMWRQFLDEMSTTESRVFVIAERADQMEADALRMLESVTAADPNGGAGANLVLLGQHELAENLRAPAFGSLNQRVRLRQRLEPLSSDELEAYLTQHVTLAGASLDRLLERDAIASLHRYCAGIPRLVNNLCETALTLAATDATPRLTSELIARVAVEVYGIEIDDAPVAIASAPPAAVLPAAAPSTVAPTTAAAPTAATPTAAAPAAVAPTTTVAPVPATSHTTLAATVAPPSTDIDLPVLTDAIEKPAPPAPAPTAPKAVPAVTPKTPAAPIAKTPAPPAAKSAQPAARQAVPTAPVVPPARAAAAPMAATPAAPPRAAVAPSPVAKVADDDDLLRQTQTMRALASAKSIDDISNSMAETLFGDEDLNMLSAALASAGWSDDDKSGGQSDSLLDELARTAVDDATAADTPWDKFDFFEQPADGLLTLLEDSPPLTDDRKRKVASR